VLPIFNNFLNFLIYMKILLILTTILLLAACQKRAIKVLPGIQGTWMSVIAAPNCGSQFSIDGKSNGSYYQAGIDSDHEGRAKIIDQVLTFGDYTMLTIAELKDSTGTVPNVDSTLCFAHLNIGFDRILRTSNGATWYHRVD
jgi:hypothetical protein